MKHDKTPTQDKPKKSGKQDKDILDHIGDFFEEHIEGNIKKGFDEVEKFLKKEFLEREKKKEADDDPLSYIKAFLKDRKVATLAPSTKFLVGRLFDRMDLPRAKVVIEYGPAEGVITRPLLERLPADARLVAVELNESFHAVLSRIEDPRLTVVRGSVLEIERIVADLRVPPADCILSGIPFSFLKPYERHKLVMKTESLLRPGGRFIAYQITTHLSDLMKFVFPEVDVDFEVRNLPPHFIFTGYKR